MPRKTKILITGVEFNNQGAYLMLVAAIEAARDRFNARPVLEHTVGSRAEKKSVGALSMVPYKLAFKIRNQTMLAFVSKLAGSVSTGDIDMVFDASGFRYGDQWKDLDLQASAGRLAWFSKQGIPVYVLPQAFGPFTETDDAAREVLQASRLIFARDPISEAYLASIPPAVEQVHSIDRAPDFTGPVDGEFPDALQHLRGAVPIVPNWNILERAGSTANAHRYKENLALIADELHSLGYSVYGLSHEGTKDTAVLEEVAVMSTSSLPIVSGLNGVQLKGLIGSAPFCVSGRFHAISSALSQGVPVLAHGWSHKYRWLLEDYGVQDLLVDPYSDASEQLSVLGQIVASNACRVRIAEARSRVARQTEAMWEAVRDDWDEVASRASVDSKKQVKFGRET